MIMTSKRKKKQKDPNSKIGICHYHLCRKKTRVYRCKYCGEYFCKEHLQAKPSGLPRFDSTKPEDKLFMEGWQKPGGHPCVPYLEIWKAEQKRKEEEYRQALDKFLRSKPIEKEPVHTPKIPISRQVPKRSTYPLQFYERVKQWFNHRNYPYSRLRTRKLMKDFLYLSILLVFSFVIYTNIESLNEIIIVFLKLGSLLLLGSCILSLKYLYRIVVNLKYGFRGLKNGYKLIAIILLLSVVLYGYQNYGTYSSQLNDFLGNIEYSYFNPIVINSSYVSEFWEHEILGYTTKEELESNPKNISLKYVLRGKTGFIQFTVYGGVNDYLSELPRSITYYEGEPEPTTKDFVMKYLNDEIQMEYLKPLAEKIKRITPNKDDQVRIAISLVQHIPYDWEGYTTMNLEGRYPYEVIYDNRGICGEKSQLLAFLLRELGFDVVLFNFEIENHMAVGIKCPVKYSYKNTGYCFIETARPTIITDYQEEYIGVSKLTSAPEIIHVSEGFSFNTVSEEYKDAQEWIRINEISKSSGGYLGEYHYNRWLYLVNKYGIEIDKE